VKSRPILKREPQATATGGESGEPRIVRPASGGNDSDEDASCRVVLRAKGIAKSYRRGLWPRRKELSVLRGADIELCSGEVVGLVGENGSGKSTLMKVLVGALDADEGTVAVTGPIGYCPQEPLLYDRLTCDEHLELFGVAYGMDPQDMSDAAESLYSSLGFARWRDTQVEELSGGTRAKLNLSLALLADPEVLLLDEPYAGFDWDTYERFWELTATRRSEGKAVLVVSHFVTDQERFDRLVEVREGLAVPR
jgi:ABC-2 type transport system ATP-binding protein